MRERRTWLVCLALAALVGALARCGDETSSPENVAPVISLVAAIPDTIVAGHATMLRCTATDANGDDLTYAWTAPGGEIWGTGSVVTWAAPIPAETYGIAVTVSDPGGNTATDSVTVEAVGPEGTLLVATDRGLTAVHTDGTSFVLRSDLRGEDVEVVEQRIFCRRSYATLDTIYELDHHGATLRTIPISDAIPYPYRLTALPGGGFATLDNENDRIDFIDSDGNFLRTVAMPYPSPGELQCISGVVVGGNLVVSETGGKKLICVDLRTFDASVLRDLSDLDVTWLSDIDFWNKYYWLCGPKESWRFKAAGDVYDLCSFSESNLVGITVVQAIGYFLINCYPSRLYRVEIPLDPCTPELLASDLGYPSDLEYIPVALTP